MTHLDAVPLWVALPAALLLVLGSGLTLLGAFGLARLQSFYDRLHAPTLGTSWGTAGIVLASVLLFSWLEGRPVLQELLIGVFVMLTTPVTLMLLGRASLHRDRAEGSAAVPPAGNARPADRGTAGADGARGAATPPAWP
ncbi:monovalent cation/H(+) antiporter subunit G [Rubellimicrobium aerolatum]|uniref:Monovalent cation/H(+) antiporter subunit G n=1 Tax=Rubellimicrobium aerolatum TaxID=490979 RepID=A0ABW0SA92_9RHOB|nr:monovalent cation/H(+) antiporter subunit G [Rubellimicrobium aerolatum]MBP1805230.1 multicomponent K+:H+ antiporter subunit G [Rubellimicrobium aerolatum]